ncbi:MAG: methyl-accepting chemotaxis protein [Ectothiorhodospiraceae bacterium]|jgi:methyl-accepting chemotaxis protein|nr:methyl-accepting chemotaxis protein [Ectothiorhodospiraceae bacterium]
MSIKARLYTLVIAGALSMTVVGGIGVIGMQHTADGLEFMYMKRLIPSGQISRIIELMMENRIHVLSMLREPIEENVITRGETITNNQQMIAALATAYLQNDLSEGERELVERFVHDNAELSAKGFEPVTAALLESDLMTSNNLLYDVIEPLYQTAREHAQELQTYQLREAGFAYYSATTEYTRIRNGVLIVLLLTVVGAIVFAFFTARRIMRGIGDLQNLSASLAAGDLTAQAPESGRDEITHLTEAFNGMARGFRDMIARVTDAASHLTSSADALTGVTEQTNAGIRRQQGETDQVATAMNEMTATVQEVARSASQAAHAAGEANDEAAKGRQVVAATMSAIDRLADEVKHAADVIHKLEGDSNDIGKVLDVISGIAEQTNLLALNAAIEAARAGEHGRGFAVVADEVRTLASRTQTSTLEIQGMIERLQSAAEQAVKVMEQGRKQAEGSVEQAAAAGASLESISRAVATINDMNAQIASASEEQGAVADEINRNIVNISQVADESADGAQRTEAASDELARLATQLQDLVARFRV